MFTESSENKLQNKICLLRWLAEALNVCSLVHVDKKPSEMIVNLFFETSNTFSSGRQRGRESSESKFLRAASGKQEKRRTMVRVRKSTTSNNNQITINSEKR